MSKFRKNGRPDSQAISTASLPDIVFILLFFFMVTTVIKERAMLVQVKEPQATETAKLQKQNLISYIYIGKAYDSRRGDQPVIQLNDAIYDKDAVIPFIESERTGKTGTEIGQMVVSLKVDKHTQMGIVTDVKQELRKVDARKINYSAKKGVEK